MDKLDSVIVAQDRNGDTKVIKPNNDWKVKDYDMRVTTYNGFKGFYVYTKSDKTFDGLELHYWAETVEECKQWIQENEH